MLTRPAKTSVQNLEEDIGMEMRSKMEDQSKWRRFNVLKKGDHKASLGEHLFRGEPFWAMALQGRVGSPFSQRNFLPSITPVNHLLMDEQKDGGKKSEQEGGRFQLIYKDIHASISLLVYIYKYIYIYIYMHIYIYIYRFICTVYMFKG